MRVAGQGEVVQDLRPHRGVSTHCRIDLPAEQHELPHRGRCSPGEDERDERVDHPRQDRDHEDLAPTPHRLAGKDAQRACFLGLEGFHRAAQCRGMVDRVGVREQEDLALGSLGKLVTGPVLAKPSSGKWLPGEYPQPLP